MWALAFADTLLETNPSVKEDLNLSESANCQIQSNPGIGTEKPLLKLYCERIIAARQRGCYRWKKVSAAETGLC